MGLYLPDANLADISYIKEKKINKISKRSISALQTDTTIFIACSDDFHSSVNIFERTRGHLAFLTTLLRLSYCPVLDKMGHKNGLLKNKAKRAILCSTCPLSRCQAIVTATCLSWRS